MLCNYPLLLLNGFVLLILLTVTVRSNSVDLWSKDYDQTSAMNSTTNACSEGAVWLGPARQRSWPQADEIVHLGALPVPGRFPRNPKQQPLEVVMPKCLLVFDMICLPIKSKLHRYVLIHKKRQNVPSLYLEAENCSMHVWVVWNIVCGLPFFLSWNRHLELNFLQIICTFYYDIFNSNLPCMHILV